MPTVQPFRTAVMSIASRSKGAALLMSQCAPPNNILSCAVSDAVTGLLRTLKVAGTVAAACAASRRSCPVP
jgi:hypothetical protein